MSWNPNLPTLSSKIRDLPSIQSNNNTAVQNVISASSLNGNLPFLPFTSSPIPAPIYLYLDVFPTGWTVYNAVVDCLLALKGGGSQYNAAGGTGVVVGTWTGPDYALKFADMSSPVQGGGVYVSFNPIVANSPTPPNAHHHDWTTTRPQAALGILATKDS